MKLSKFPYDKRIKKIKDILENNEIDVAVITKPENTYYFSLFQAIIYSRPIIVTISKNDDLTLIVPYLDLDHAKEKSPASEIKSYKNESELNSLLNDRIKRFKKIGLDTESISFYNKIKRFVDEVYDISSKINNLRAVKDESELERIRISAEITDKGMEKAMEAIKEGKREIEISAIAEFEMKTRLSDILGDDGFYPWMNFTVSAAISGPRSYYPHGLVSGKKVSKGEQVIITQDIAVEGYRSENERTVILGKPSKEMEKMFNLMEESQKVAFSHLKEGAISGEVDKNVMEFFSKNNLTKYVNHRTGHGIGLEIHEFPSIAEGDNTVIRKNMTLAIEPGIYVPGLGGFRHSDTVLIKDDGLEVLTKTKKGLEHLVL